MATLVCAQLAVATGELRYACAGHPPPLIVPPAGSPRFLWDGRSVPLDALAAVGPREDGTHTMEPGSVLLLYTDGLVERRSEPLTDGMERLVAEAGARRELATGVLVGGVMAALRESEHADDVCVLAARLVEE
jgi:serine/threonine-protein kinase RsbW